MIDQLDATGKRLISLVESSEKMSDLPSSRLLELPSKLHQENSFFGPGMLREAIRTMGCNFDKTLLKYYFGDYLHRLPADDKKKIVSLVPLNNPLGGVTDLIRALIFNRAIIFRLPQENKKILPVLVDFLSGEIPGIYDLVTFTEGMTPKPDVLFTYDIEKKNSELFKYFSRYKGVVRERKKSAAILSGKESTSQLEALAHGVMAYFGQSRHNISKLFIPRNYDLNALMNSFREYEHLSDHNRYRNNYDYYKSVYLLNSESFTDNGFALFKEEPDEVINPLSVVYFERYSDEEDLDKKVDSKMFQKIYYRNKNSLITSEMLYPDLFSLEDNKLFLQALKVIE